jgi:ABC-2 type transport system ATP-binding protein
MNEVISLEKVSKILGMRKILNEVTLAVEKGDIFGYLGPNGAGKTTTIRIILGLMQPSSGKAAILGQDAANDKIREKVGFILESDGLYDNMNAFDNLDYYARLYELGSVPDRIEKAVKTVGLADRLYDKVSSFSKGMRQRLALARALVPNPEVLVLDEPTSGVDPSGQIEIREIMLDMAHKQGKTILLSSHNLDEVQRICNRIALIQSGEIKLYGELDELQRRMSSGESIIETADDLDATTLTELQKFPDIKVKSYQDRRLVFSTGAQLDVSTVVSLLAARGVRIRQVKQQEASLEEMYTAIMKETEHQDHE